MAIRDEGLKKARAFAVLQKIVMEGKTTRETAKEMGISHDTVQRAIAYSRQANLFLQYEQKLMEDALPLAHDAVILALQDGNSQVALEVIKGLGLLNRGKTGAQAVREDEDGLYAEIARQRSGSIIDVSPPALGDGSDDWNASIESAGDSVDFVSDSLPSRPMDGIEEDAAVEGESWTPSLDASIEDTES